MDKKHSFTGQYFLFLLGKLKTCIVLSVIFACCGFPMDAAAGNIKAVSTETLLRCLAAVSITGMAMLSFVTPLIAMKHLYTKTAADNILSLPLTALQRYCCEAGAAICVYAVPLLASLPVSYALRASGANISLETALLFLLTLLMFSALNIFLTCFCGRLAEAVIYPLAINLIMPLFWRSVISLSRVGIYGLYGAGDEYSPYYTLYVISSPLGFFDCFTRLFGFYTSQQFIAALLYTAVLLAFGYLVYRKRPAENVGQPFVYKYAFTVSSLLISFAGAVSLIALGILNSGAIGRVAAAVFAAFLLILMLVMEFVSRRSPNSLPKFALKYIGVIAAASLVSYLVYASDGFGETRYIPTADETAYIDINLGEKRLYSYANGIQTVIKGDGAAAELVRAEQRSLIEKKETDKSDVLRVNYILKNGNTVSRYYEGASFSDGFRKKIVESDEYKYSGLRRAELISDERNIVQDGAEVLDPYTGESLFVTLIKWDELKAALEHDLENDSSFGRRNDAAAFVLAVGEYYGNTDNDGVYRRYVSSAAAFNIYDSYTETIAYMKRFGYLPTAAESLDKALKGELFSLVRIDNYDGIGEVVHRSASAFAGDSQSAVFLKGDEVREIALHTAEYAYTDGQEYTYIMEVGPPGFFTYNSDFIAEGCVDRLEAEGILDSYAFRRDEYGVYYDGARKTFLLNEQYYPELEKYFEPGDREVYSFSMLKTPTR